MIDRNINIFQEQCIKDFLNEKVLNVAEIAYPNENFEINKKQRSFTNLIVENDNPKIKVVLLESLREKKILAEKINNTLSKNKDINGKVVKKNLELKIGVNNIDIHIVEESLKGNNDERGKIHVEKNDSKNHFIKSNIDPAFNPNFNHYVINENVNIPECQFQSVKPKFDFFEYKNKINYNDDGCQFDSKDFLSEKNDHDPESKYFKNKRLTSAFSNLSRNNKYMPKRIYSGYSTNYNGKMTISKISINEDLRSKLNYELNNIVTGNICSPLSSNLHRNNGLNILDYQDINNKENIELKKIDKNQEKYETGNGIYTLEQKQDGCFNHNYQVHSSQRNRKSDNSVKIDEISLFNPTNKNYENELYIPDNLNIKSDEVKVQNFIFNKNTINYRNLNRKDSQNKYISNKNSNSKLELGKNYDEIQNVKKNDIQDEEKYSFNCIKKLNFNNNTSEFMKKIDQELDYASGEKVLQENQKQNNKLQKLKTHKNHIIKNESLNKENFSHINFSRDDVNDKNSICDKSSYSFNKNISDHLNHLKKHSKGKDRIKEKNFISKNGINDLVENEIINVNEQIRLTPEKIPYKIGNSSSKKKSSVSSFAELGFILSQKNKTSYDNTLNEDRPNKKDIFNFFKIKRPLTALNRFDPKTRGKNAVKRKLINDVIFTRSNPIYKEDNKCNQDRIQNNLKYVEDEKGGLDKVEVLNNRESPQFQNEEPIQIFSNSFSENNNIKSIKNTSFKDQNLSEQNLEKENLLYNNKMNIEQNVNIIRVNNLNNLVDAQLDSSFRLKLCQDIIENKINIMKIHPLPQSMVNMNNKIKLSYKNNKNTKFSKNRYFESKDRYRKKQINIEDILIMHNSTLRKDLNPLKTTNFLMKKTINAVKKTPG